MLTATVLGISPLGWFLIFFGVTALGAGVFAGWFIAGAEAPIEPMPVEPESAAHLDDWLAQEEPLLEFNVYRQPEASARVGGFDGLR